jgi:caa(3)-type oxidase subunit IV
MDHKKIFIRVWIALMALTVVTALAAYVDLGGKWNILVAMLIATVKGTLVCLFFMELKYDNMLNRVVFASSFVFLAIFVGLTATDEWVRESAIPAEVQAVEKPAGAQAAEHEKFRRATKELVAAGKTIYLAQCMACHGMNGQGDGPAAAALKPPPRDFTSGIWKLGGSPAQVFKTLTDGMPGTPMPPFSSLSTEDRWAIVHYIRSLSPNTPEDTPRTLAAIGAGPGAPKKKKPSPELPVEFIIDRIDQGE